MSQFPRNGQYELFTTNNRTYCFDDPGFIHVPTPAGMFEWIRSQDPAYWKPMDEEPESNTALYLQPELYFIWKLKYS